MVKVVVVVVVVEQQEELIEVVSSCCISRSSGNLRGIRRSSSTSSGSDGCGDGGRDAIISGGEANGCIACSAAPDGVGIVLVLVFVILVNKPKTISDSFL